MAILFFDGFENDYPRRWATDGITSTAGRNGGKDVLVQGNVADANWIEYLDLPPVSAPDALVIGFAINFIAFAEYGNTHTFLLIKGADGALMGELKTGSGIGNNLQFDGGVVSARGTKTLASGRWYYVEVRYVPESGAGGSVEVWVDGVLDITATGNVVDGSTRPTGQIRFYSTDHVSNDFYLDDLYVLDSTGTVNNGPLGDVFVTSLLPSAQGNYAQGVGSDGNATDNYLLVDEDPASEADYVELDGIGDRESYAVPVLPDDHIPIAVRASSLVLGGDNSPTLDHFLRIAGVDHDAGEEHSVPLLKVWRDTFWNVNPATGLPWAENDLDGVEVGVRRTA